MVKLDLSVLRYMSRDDFRVLTALEMGMKNHDLVSTQLINSLAQLRRGDAVLAIQNLHKNKLVYHESKPYDGYRLTYHGYDFLSVKTHSKRNNLAFIGNQIGTGKESDVFLGQDGSGNNVAVKFHRLGRTSFRSIKRNRDYHQGRTHASWLYLSRLAALKEFAYMKVLHDHGFPVPTPIDVNRHVIVMEYLQGYTTLYHIHELKNPSKAYNTLMNLLVSLAQCGLIHGDFNEFNLMIHEETENIIMIDFPQMVSIDHPNADEYFNRDVDGIRNFFKKRFGFHGAEYPVLSEDVERKFNLDKDIQASGYTREMEEDFEELAQAQGNLEEEGSEVLQSNSTERPIDSKAATFEEIDINQEDDPTDGEDDEADAEFIDEVSKLAGSESHATTSTSPKVNGNDNEAEQDDDDDSGPEGETRKERRDRLRKRSVQKELEEQEKIKAIQETEETIIPEPGEEGLSDDAIRRARIIRSRVKAQFDAKRNKERGRIRNAFKHQVRKNLSEQTKGWQDDI